MPKTEYLLITTKRQTSAEKMIDHSKVGRIALNKFADIKNIDILITNAKATKMQY